MRKFSLLICCLLVSCAYQPTTKKLDVVSNEKQLSIIQTHLLLGQWRLAKKSLDHFSDASKNVNYWRLYSLYWLSVDSVEKAIFVHKYALDLFPKDDFILNNYGVLLGHKKDWKSACEAFGLADQNALFKRQSVQINLARCAFRQNDVNLAEIYLKQAKEIDDLPLIGLMTELNLVLIQGSKNKARIIFNNIQAGKKIARNSVHFDEYNCLSRHMLARETDPTLYSSASNFICLNGSRY